MRGVRIGHLAYAYGLNGFTAPTPWSVNLIDPARIRADAAAIRRAGAQFVVVSLHFGYPDTVRALPAVLEELAHRGLSAVTTTELFS